MTHWSCYIQWILWKCGVSWHNSFRDECTPDFSCCIDKYTPEEQEWLRSIAGSNTGVVPISKWTKK